MNSPNPHLIAEQQFDAKAFKRNLLKLVKEGKYHHTIERRIRKIPLPILPKYMKAIEGNSRSAAVFSFCCECMGWDNYTAGVKECTDLGCPLYNFRPYKDKE